MPRDVRILILCDPCFQGGHEVPGEEYTITVNKTGPKVVILCGEHEPIVKEVTELMAMGYTPGAEATPAKPPRARTNPPSNRGTFTCMYACGATSPTAEAITMHYRKYHHNTVSGVFGLTCPLCGVNGSGPQSTGMHATRGHDASGIADAFRIAEEQGDPHGIVAARKKTLQEAS